MLPSEKRKKIKKLNALILQFILLEKVTEDA